MSLPQDSLFEACYKCHTSVSVADILRCYKCEKVFHHECAEKPEHTDQWTCDSCRKEMNATSKPKSVQSKKVGSTSSRSTSRSSIFNIKLKLLEEKQKLLDDQCREREHQLREKELQLQEKHKLQNELLDSKIALLKESFEELEDEEDSVRSNDKVKSWLNENEGLQKRDQQPEARDVIEDKPKYSSTKVQGDALQFDLHAVSKGQQKVSTTTFQVCSENKNSHQPIIEVHEPPKLSSTAIGVETLHQPKVGTSHFENTKVKFNRAQDLEFNHSIIASRQVIGKRLPEFNGDPLKWPAFISMYETSSTVCQMTNAENLLRLNEALKGDAYKAVEKLLYIPDNVPTIIEILQNVFGRPEFIINSMLESIRSEPKPKYEVFDTIIAFSLQVNNLCATMRACSISDSGPWLMQELVDKLPNQMKFDWAVFKTSLRSVNLEVFNNWLEVRAVSLTSVLSKPPQLTRSMKPNKGYLNLHSTNEQSTCLICLKDCQEVAKCSIFCDANYADKWKYVKDHNLCRICLRKHQGRCNSGKRCEISDCSYKHHTLLHKPVENLENPVHFHNEASSSTLFKVLPVFIYGPNGKYISTYAFLDEGSSVTLLDSSIADELQLEGVTAPLCLKWTKNQTITDPNSRSVGFGIKGLQKGSNIFTLSNVRTMQDLKLPRQSLNMKELSSRYFHLKNVPAESFIDIEPRILIGLDNVRLCSTHKNKVGKANEPMAAKTSLGWAIYGCSSVGERSKYSLHMCECNELSTVVRNFIVSDNLNVKEAKSFSSYDQKVLKAMENSITYNDGKYSCGLLWRYEKPTLPESFPMAKQRSECLLRRLRKDANLHKNLDEKIRDYVKKGYVRKLSDNEINSHQTDHWYLPVFPVVNPNKPGKIRLVWDAAAKSKNVSLNDVLHKGPDLLNSLPGILLRFREKRIGLAGDIMEMFHQIRVLESEQKYHWFLWQHQEEDSPSTYAMTVMSFGAACSPCISQFVKNHHASKYEKIYPRAVAAIQKNHYVDDWLDSFDSEEEAFSISSEVYKILFSGGFTMRNWISNSYDVTKGIGNISNSQKIISENDEQVEKVLGMWWDTTSDAFLFTLKFNKGNKEILHGEKLPTKREVLRIVMSIYDPLGLVAQIVVYAKILLQQIWQIKLQWDDEIPENLAAHWKEWLLMLKNIQEIRIPRWYSEGLTDAEYELHTFVDGSEQAYAAVSYIRCLVGENIVCNLMSAKTRTAPLKPLSIPRLELQSAVLGSRLAKFILENSNIKLKKRVFWTDSKTVMCWLQNEPRKFKQFVSCRIAEILESSEIDEWKWVPTKHNPADIATRMKITNEDVNKVWYSGPHFLYTLSGDEQFDNNVVSPINDADEELRANTFLHHEVVRNLVPIEHFSSFRKIRRRYYFIFWCFLTWKKKALKLSEICIDNQQIYNNAENHLFKEAQKEVYGNEIAALSSNSQIERNSSLLKLSPYLDVNNVLRTNGRIDYAPDALQNTKRPIIMPPSHPISRLIIDHYHKKYNHINHETVVNELRQKFSISRLRAELKKVIYRCQYCKNKKATPNIPEMAPLPPARLSSFTSAFTFSGIDYFGPINVLIGRRTEKRWGLLVTCLTVRAIHIELAHSLTTSSCILALRNFINRRGKPQEIYCDNGTNFRGASRELKEAIDSIDKEKIASEFIDFEIKWCFNPPAAPHMGGAWERLVRSVKTNLQAITSSKLLQEEVLRSLLIEIENIINSRPLTYIPIDDENAEALTPNHFLKLSSSGNKPIGVFSDDARYLSNSWCASQQLADLFWKRWIKEYQPTLVRRTKWFQPSKPIQVGDVVIVFEDNLPRSCYPRGMVIDGKPQ